MVSEACPTNPREASGLDPEAVHVAIDEERNTVAVPDPTVDTDEGERLREKALAGADDDSLTSTA